MLLHLLIFNFSSVRLIEGCSVDILILAAKHVELHIVDSVTRCCKICYNWVQL